MEHNPYLPPLARVDDTIAAAGDDALFLVVAPAKFWTMMVGTFGLYSFYWFYKHWALLNRRHEQYWPVPRAVFSIFFTHSLFDEVDAQLKRRGSAHRWAPRATATVYVVASIASQLLGRAAEYEIGSPLTDIASFLLMVPIFASLYRGQRAINVAEGDPGGARNRRITLANALWLVLGGAMWLLILFGLYLIASGEAV